MAIELRRIHGGWEAWCPRKRVAAQGESKEAARNCLAWLLSAMGQFSDERKRASRQKAQQGRGC